MISHELKTIFIHTPRTGGTSIETALVGNNWWKIEPKTKHIDCTEAKRVYAEYWSEYLKFAVVRNPWDWMVSLYYSHNRGKEKTWGEFVNNPGLFAHEQSTIIQSEIIGDEIDFILRFETLQEDFRQLCTKLAIDRKLPHIQLSEVPYSHYSSCYDAEQKRAVAEIFKADVERFNYSYVETKVAEIQHHKLLLSNWEGEVVDLRHKLSEEQARSEQLEHLLAEVRAELKTIDEPNRSRIHRYLTRILNTITFTRRNHRE